MYINIRHPELDNGSYSSLPSSMTSCDDAIMLQLNVDCSINLSIWFHEPLLHINDVTASIQYEFVSQYSYDITISSSRWNSPSVQHLINNMVAMLSNTILLMITINEGGARSSGLVRLYSTVGIVCIPFSWLFEVGWCMDYYAVYFIQSGLSVCNDIIVYQHTAKIHCTYNA